jgi:hypothetical protein
MDHITDAALAIDGIEKYHGLRNIGQTDRRDLAGLEAENGQRVSGLFNLFIKRLITLVRPKQVRAG